MSAPSHHTLQSHIDRASSLAGAWLTDLEAQPRDVRAFPANVDALARVTGILYRLCQIQKTYNQIQNYDSRCIADLTSFINRVQNLIAEIETGRAISYNSPRACLRLAPLPPAPHVRPIPLDSNRSTSSTPTHKPSSTESTTPASPTSSSSAPSKFTPTAIRSFSGINNPDRHSDLVDALDLTILKLIETVQTSLDEEEAEDSASSNHPWPLPDSPAVNSSSEHKTNPTPTNTS